MFLTKIKRRLIESCSAVFQNCRVRLALGYGKVICLLLVLEISLIVTWNNGVVLILDLQEMTPISAAMTILFFVVVRSFWKFINDEV